MYAALMYHYSYTINIQEYFNIYTTKLFQMFIHEIQGLNIVI